MGGAAPPRRVGRVHSVESFGTVDGPGIRVVVFFQGCHLRCQFCHNRDTWMRSGGSERAVDDLAAEILRYRAFFERSGGGITASGGDPILQAPFVADLFETLQRQGVHTALDTSGLVRIGPEVQRLLDATSLVILDIKHPDDRRHRELTGATNSLSLAFARHVAELGRPMWIRHVIVPGWTDDNETAAALAILDRSLGAAVERVELLPYHAWGKEKWERLGIPYPLERTPTPSAEEMARIRDQFAEHGLPVVVP